MTWRTRIGTPLLAGGVALVCGAAGVLPARAQTDNPFAAVECRWVGQKATQSLDRIMVPLIQKRDKASKRSNESLQGVADEVMRSKALQLYLSCLSDQRLKSER